MVTVASMLRMAATRTPDQLAVVEGSFTWTYRDLWDRSTDMARMLCRAGLEPGDRVAVLLKNTAAHVALMVATQRLGLVYVPLNFRFKMATVEDLVVRSGARALVGSPEVVENLTRHPALTERLHHVWVSGGLPTEGVERLEDAWMSEGTDALPEEPEPDALSLILFTSGTTGIPKGIPLTHANVVARTVGPALNWGLPHGGGERVLGVLPLYHTIGIQASMLYALFMNHTYYPVPDFVPPDVVRLVAHERITHIFGTPTHLHALLTAKDAAPDPFRSVRYVLYGGAPMSQAVLTQCRAVFGPDITNVYGNTETYNALSMRRFPDHPNQLEAGIYHRVRVVRLGGGPQDEVAVGEEGELIVDVSSPESFRGYWENPEETSRKVRDGWYFTGDTCVRLPDSRYWVTGRADDMIITGGENVQPATVEDVIMGHPGVLDVAVRGVPDDHWGQLVKAYVVRRDPSLTADMLDAWLKSSRLENFQRPRRYTFVEAIPRNPSGKILRRELHQLDEDGLPDAHPAG
jgi:2-furoate---CoA ligase